MGKNIIISSDGTGNAGGKGHDSNVWRLHTAIDKHGHTTDTTGLITKQITYYHDGVGTDDNKIMKIIGGAIGHGLGRIVIEMYVFLANNYEPGDKIFLFGFSRGAYSIRILAGIISSFGVLNKKGDIESSEASLKLEVEQVYEYFMLKNKIKKYRKIIRACGKANKECENQKTLNTQEPKIHKKLFKYLFIAAKNQYTSCKKKLSAKKHSKFITYRKKFERDNEELLKNKNIHLNCKVSFIGIWDTVDAYAIPSDTIAGWFDFWAYTSFRQYDNKLSQQTEKACHALSIDDARRIFEPVLWNEDEEQKDGHPDIKQVWFSGVHSNVGGGYPKQGMAWITLDWMIEEAEKSGLRFMQEDTRQYTENKDANDRMYDSRAGLAAYYAFKRRNITELCNRFVFNGAKPNIHISVFERIARQTQGYAPTNIPEKFNIILSGNQLYDTENINSLYDLINNTTQPKILEGSNEIKLHKNPLEFIRHYSAYITFWSQLTFLIFILWFSGFSWESALYFVIFSLVLWWGIRQCVIKVQNAEHNEYSTFWRKMIENPIWKFLRD